MRGYRYDLGFKVNNTPIPDPSAYSGQTSDLDTSAERDVTGLLHRNRVAQKVPVEMSWKGLDWPVLTTILQAVNSDSFQFTFPDPNTGLSRSGTYYAGDRKWEGVWMPAGEGAYGEGWYFNLSFSIIEY